MNLYQILQLVTKNPMTKYYFYLQTICLMKYLFVLCIFLKQPWNDPSVGELGMILGSPSNSSGVEGRGSSDSVVSGTSMAWLDKCRDPTNPAGVHTATSSSVNIINLFNV